MPSAASSPPKFELGLFEHPYTDRTNISSIGSPAHRAVARRAAAESQVLLKNSGHALPLSKTAKIYVAGSNANDIGNQAGGWTVTWQGQSGNVIPGTTILGGIKQDDPNVTYSPDASAPTTGAKWESSWSVRRPTQKAWATSGTTVTR